MQVMQSAYDSLRLVYNLPALELEPTDVYVRFLPKDSLEYNMLLALGTELFDFPLDYEYSVEMESFHDPTVPDSLITWQYTVVPYGTSLPTIQYEVLDTCYIPQEEPQRGLPCDFFEQLESLADSIANPINSMVRRESANTRGGVYPCGYVKVSNYLYDNVGEPVRGVKVKVFKCVKTGYGYTNANGFYCINKKFYADPHYTLSFENEKGFSEYGMALSIQPSWVNKKQHSKNGYNFLIGYNEEARDLARVNNCIYDYYVGCEQDGSTKPPSDLRVLFLTDVDAQGSGAPMLRQIGYDDSLRTVFLNYLQSKFNSGLISYVYKLLRYALPDVMILSPSNYSTLKETVYHEMSHASHYSNAGFPLWIKVIRETVRNSYPVNNGYGDGLLNDVDQNACELAEAWAFANQRVYQDVNTSGPAIAGTGLWFDPSITALYRAMKSGILSRAQIISQMTHSASSIDALLSRLMMEYPSQRYLIGRVFAEEGSLFLQTRWRIINHSGESIELTRRWASFIQRDTLSYLDTVSFSAYPSSINTFYSLKNTYFYPEEFLIRRLSPADTVFYQINGITLEPMHHPFFNTAEWNEVNTYLLSGNTTIRDYYYTIFPADVL